MNTEKIALSELIQQILSEKRHALGPGFKPQPRLRLRPVHDLQLRFADFATWQYGW